MERPEPPNLPLSPLERRRQAVWIALLMLAVLWLWTLLLLDRWEEIRPRPIYSTEPTAPDGIWPPPNHPQGADWEPTLREQLR